MSSYRLKAGAKLLPFLINFNNMKKGVLILVSLWLAAVSANAHPLGFVRNMGQVIDTDGNTRTDVLYTAETSNATLFIMRDRIACVLKEEKSDAARVHAMNIPVSRLVTSRFDIILGEGGEMLPGQQMPGYNNYYLAHCPQGITHVPSFSQIVYKNIYDHIDLELTNTIAGLKLEYLVRENGDPSLVKIRFKGEQAYRLNINNVVDVTASAGIFHFGVNVVAIDGKRTGLTEKNIHGSCTKLSPSPQPLTSTTWATYIGGSDSDEGAGIALDSSGDAYSAGYTQSIDLPVGTGTVQDTLTGGYDAFLFKIDNATGNRVWATFYGGSGTDFGYRVKVHNYMAVLCGYGSSTDLPMSPGAWQPASAGSYDAFIARFNPNGTLDKTTYYGGPNGELLLAMGLDKAGNVFAGGATGSSTGLPITAGAYQPAHGGAMDAFCAKFDGSLNLVWATYYGGSGSEDMHAMTLDTSANVIFSGGTYSTNFPVSANAFQTMTMGGGEAYLVKMDSSGARVWATYIGGFSNDDINGLAADMHNNIYAAGYSESLDFPVTNNAYQSSLAGASDAVIAKFNSNGTAAWITFYGGSMADYATSIVTDTSNNIFIGGYTASSDFPVSSGAFQPNNAGSTDGFFLRFDSAQVFGWATHFGGSYDDYAHAIAVDDMWNVFIGGTTSSFSLPDTAGVMQPVTGGNGDAFLAKLDGSYGLTIGIDKVSPGGFKVYPNPSSDIVFIDLPGDIGEIIFLSDVTGRVVRTFLAGNAQKISADIGSLPAGLYLLSLNNGKSIARIIKM
jgi:hypothetical protein